MERGKIALICACLFICASVAVALDNTPRSRLSNTVQWQTRPQSGGQTVKVADQFPGSDLGAKINAADKALGNSPGEILVKAGGVISTQVVLGSYHKLRFAPGVYTLQTELLWQGAFLLKSHTQVTGSGWDTIIVEPPRTGWIVFQSYEDAKSNPVHSGTDSDLSITNLQIKGANPAVEGGVRQTLNLGNCVRCNVEGVWLNGTGVIGVAAGGNSLKGNHADTVVIRKNTFTSVASQAAAVVNGKNIVIDGNTFKDSGRPGGQMGMTAIDLEPNAPEDIIQNITITNNVVDSRGSAFLHGNGILVQNTAHTLNFGPVLVKGNTVIGGEMRPNVSGLIAVGIYISGYTQDVEVANNILRRISHSGIRLEHTTRNYVHDNTLISTGSGGTLAFEVNNTTDSRIFNNVVTIDGNSPAATSIIAETGTSFNNVYKGNTGGKDVVTPVTSGKSKILN